MTAAAPDVSALCGPRAPDARIPERPGGDRHQPSGYGWIPRGGPRPPPDLVRQHLVADLLRTLPGRGDDVAASLDAVLALASLSCPSCVAVSLTHDRDGRTTTVTATTDPGCTDAPSMEIRSPSAGPDRLGAGSAVLVVFATDPLALSRLADDVALLGAHRCRVTLRARSRIPPPSSTDVVGAGQLHDRATVDRALGALLEQGWAPGEGREELQRRADTAGIPLLGAASVVLAALPGAPGRTQPDRRSPDSDGSREHLPTPAQPRRGDGSDEQ